MAEPEKIEVFPADFLEGLPADALEMGAALHTQFSAVLLNNRDEQWKVGHNLHFYDAYGTLQSLMSRTALVTETPELTGEIEKDIPTIARAFGLLGKWAENNLRMRSAKLAVENAKERTDRLLSGNAPHAFEFSDDDFSRVQTLMNELRDLLRNSDEIPEKHKRRQLRKLEKLQAELHKTTSDLDRFVGFVADMGLMLGRFGVSVKPLVDRVIELGDIAVRVMGASHGIPQLPGQQRRTRLLSFEDQRRDSSDDAG